MRASFGIRGPVFGVLLSLLVLGSCDRGGPSPEMVGSDAPDPTSVLYGRVVPSDNATPQADWNVRVSAEYEDGLEIAPHDRDSTGDLFAFKVVPGRRVRLYFEAVPYQASTTEYIDVTTDRSYAYRLPDIVMERIRWSMALFASGNGEAFARNLEAEADIAEQTGSDDIFRANLEYYRKASAKFPDCMRKLEAFERTPRAIAITKRAEARGLPVSALRTLAMNPAELARTQPDALRGLAANPRVAGSLRAEANRALSAPATPVSSGVRRDVTKARDPR